MRLHHCIRAAALAASVAVSAAAQPPQPGAQPPRTGDVQAPSSFTIFVRGVPIGTEQIGVSRTADGWTISSSGRLGAPLDVVARRIQVRYTPDWHPVEFLLDGTVKGQPQSVHTIVEGTTATSDISVGGQTTHKTDTIDPASALILSNSFFASYEAVAVRL